ncbi:MAG: hypothetical protein B7X67_22955 [Rhizobiales bacterium 39-66-18]|nr:MAG: hypothetical protein B7X67_22955 [Rhizobiales bacterium 39-66-18]
MTYRLDIDGVRAIAVLSVLLFHLGVPGVPGGFVGVDVFFVISGYLITANILADVRGGTFSLLRFYDRRIRRIVPALTLVVLATLAVGYFILTRRSWCWRRWRWAISSSRRAIMRCSAAARPMRRAGSRISSFCATPAISMQRRKPCRCSTPGRSGWRSNSM